MLNKIISITLVFTFLVVNSSIAQAATSSSQSFSSPLAEKSFKENGKINKSVSLSAITKNVNQGKELITSSSMGCSQGCSMGCSSGCSSGCSMGCSSGCSMGCR